MIDSQEITRTWALLARDPVQSGGLRVRELVDVATAEGHPLLALDAQGRRHLLIPVGPAVSIDEDRRSSGVQVVGHSLIDAHEQRTFVDVVCRKPHLNELYALIASEVLDGLTLETMHPDLVARTVLERWRELLEREPSDEPGLTTLTGLFGELWYLRQLVQRNPSALGVWMGPTGARHDFMAGDLALEVKATRTRHGRFFEIHGHEQLEAPTGVELYLGALKLELVPSGEHSIGDLINRVLNAGVDRSQLMMLLAQAGVGPEDLDLCGRVRFRVLEDRVYIVASDFPRVVAASFVGGVVPAGVLRLVYQIDVTSEPPYPLSQSEVNDLYSRLSRA